MGDSSILALIDDEDVPVINESGIPGPADESQEDVDESDDDIDEPDSDDEELDSGEGVVDIYIKAVVDRLKDEMDEDEA
ncbi:hypothetical protein HK102_001368, partial [Quaeritorhiza haematococci]